MRPEGTFDEEYSNVEGRREDEQDLIQMWLEKHSDENSLYVWNQTEFDNVNPVTTDKLLGDYHLFFFVFFLSKDV